MRYGVGVLVNDMERNGNWLFRYRNHLPLLLVPLMAIALRHSEGIERRFGGVAEGVWEALCIAITLAGFAIRCLVVGYSFPGASGRNSRAQQAVSLNTRGMYSVVRHPLYLGNFLMMVGAISMIEVWWLTLVAVLAFQLYYERIIVAEEAFLANRFGARYQEWAAVTPAFIPAITRWQTPRVPFSVKRVLVRETPTFAQIVVVDHPDRFRVRLGSLGPGRARRLPARRRGGTLAAALRRGARDPEEDALAVDLRLSAAFNARRRRPPALRRATP